ncbi:hypothetical protein ACRC7T_18190 [Segnochrobactraceae bacterium EtOH-i3]
MTRPSPSAIHRWHRSTSWPGGILAAPETCPEDLDTEQIIQVDMTAQDAEAIARLVTAAPDLLLAAIGTARWWDAIGSQIFNQPPPAIRSLRNAIDIAIQGTDQETRHDDRGI